MAAAGLRIAGEATLYAQFRSTFGIPVASFPLMINQINELKEYAKRTAASAFKVHSEYIHFGEELISRCSFFLHLPTNVIKSLF